MKALEILLIICTFAIVSIYITRGKRVIEENFNDVTMNKLNKLQMKMYEYVDLDILIKKVRVTPDEVMRLKKSTLLSSMYKDSDLIILLESIIGMYKYGPHKFYSLLKGTNTILKIREDTEKFLQANGTYPINTMSMFNKLLELKSNCMNNIHDLVYVMPKNKEFFKYHDQILIKYDKLITRNIDIMYNHVMKSIELKGIDSSTKFPDYSPNTRTVKAYKNTESNRFFV